MFIPFENLQSIYLLSLDHLFQKAGRISSALPTVLYGGRVYVLRFTLLYLFLFR